MRCSAVTRDGKPCPNWAVSGTNPPLCFAHIDKNTRTALKEKRESPAAVLREELRQVRRLPPSLEKARLVVEITKLLREIEGKPTAEFEPRKEDETVHEYAKRLRAK